MKRIPNKSGSTAALGSSNIFPAYQQLIPTLSSNKQQNSHLLQELKNEVNNTHHQQDQKCLKNTKISSTSANYSSGQANSISKSNTSNVFPLSSSQVSSPPQSYSSNSFLGSGTKQNDSIPLIYNSQKIINAHKGGSFNPSAYPSSVSVQQLLNSSSNMSKNQHISTSKSPSHPISRSPLQNTPTASKNNDIQNHFNIGGISPKTLIMNGQKQTVFHSHRPSLAANGSHNNHINNENLSINRRQESKPDLQKKPFFSTPQENSTPQSQQSNILRENNNIKNVIHNIPYHPASQSITKEQVEGLTDSHSKKFNSKNIRNNSCNTESSINAVSSLPTNGSIQGNSLKNSNALSSSPLGYYPSQLSSDKSGSQQGKQHYVFNGTNPTQNTETDPQGLTMEQSNLINTSGLSAITTVNLSQNILSERSGVELQNEILPSPPHSSIPDLFTQKCSNHPYKKAKYIISNSQSSNNYYCSKCTVELSKIGFQTIHIADYAKPQESASTCDLPSAQKQSIYSNQSPLNNKESSCAQETETQIKLKDINHFLESIDIQGGRWQELNHALLIKKKDVSNFFERQQLRVQSQFNGYHDLLTQMKNSTLHKLSQNKEQSVSIYQHWEKETKESLTDFINIKADIEMNTDKIVNLIQMDDFSRIMSSYREKLAKMTQFFSSMSSQCLDLIKFDNSSPSPLSLAPQIEQSFSVLNFSTTLVKKRVSEFISIKKDGTLQQSSSPQTQQALYTSNVSQSMSPNVKTQNDSQFHEGFAKGQLISGNEIQSHNLSKVHSPNGFPSATQTVAGEESNLTGSNFQSSCSSPVKIDASMKLDQTKKDIYVSFGNNKDLHKAAIQQTKNSHISHQPAYQQHQNFFQTNKDANDHSSSYHSQIQEEFIQGSPLHNNGIYMNQIKPLTDIIEHTNMNEEDDKSQQNTPELKQVDEIQSRILTPSQNTNGVTADSQKPFRTLFEEEDHSSKTQESLFAKHENSNQTSELSPDRSGSLVSIKNSSNQPRSPNPNFSNGQGNVIQCNNSNGLQKNSSGSSKSPRYSMYENIEGEIENTMNHPVIFPFMKSNNNNNQLEEYLQFVDKQGDASNKLSNSEFNYNYSRNSYLPQTYGTNLQNIKQSSSCSPSNRIYQSRDGKKNKSEIINQIKSEDKEDEVIVTQDRQEEMDNPLFSSPSYQ